MTEQRGYLHGETIVTVGTRVRANRAISNWSLGDPIDVVEKDALGVVSQCSGDVSIAPAVRVKFDEGPDVWCSVRAIEPVKQEVGRFQIRI